MPKSIIHLDLDSFYASAEVLDDPSLKGLPVIVGGTARRGVVSTASYEARAFGVRSGMPTAEARARCPQGIFLPGRMGRYRELSDMVMAIFLRYTPLVEPLSLDEAFLDVSGSEALFGPAVGIAERIRAEVREETGLTISGGVATQKHIAKIASGLNKPDALTVVPPGSELDFLWPLDLKKLWGAGKVTQDRMRARGLRTIGDLARLPEGYVASWLGEGGRHMWHLANARDFREVVPFREAKSVGAEETYGEDIRGGEAVSRELLRLAVRVSERLRQAGLSGRSVTVKLRDPSFKTITRSKSVPEPLEDYLPIHRLALELASGRTGPFRLLGIQVGKLGPPATAAEAQETAPPAGPKPLFGDGPPKKAPGAPTARPGLSEAMDLINERHGRHALGPATLLDGQGRPGRKGRKP
ncbi:MAG: DNA polymerase IV [Deltaproteobacteria bacterium]|jgi:DNA polymerase-4|nr:DNA polymerase IV [Deltaproteobacteria bacterium]